MRKKQTRLSEKHIEKILNAIIPAYHDQYPVIKRHSELTKPDTVDDGVSYLIDFWEKNWERKW